MSDQVATDSPPPPAPPPAGPGPSEEQHSWASRFTGIATRASGLFDRAAAATDSALGSVKTAAAQTVDKVEAGAAGAYQAAKETLHDAGSAIASSKDGEEVADKAAHYILNKGADLAQKAVDAAPLPDAAKGAAKTYVKFEKGVAGGVYTGVKDLAKGAMAATDIMTGAAEVKLAKKAAELATSEQARQDFKKEVKDDAETALNLGELGVKLTVDPVGTGAELGVAIGKQLKDGYDKADAKGEAPEYVGDLVGQAAVFIGSFFVGGEAGEAAKLEDAVKAVKLAREGVAAAKTAEEAAAAAKALREAEATLGKALADAKAAKAAGQAGKAADAKAADAAKADAKAADAAKADAKAAEAKPGEPGGDPPPKDADPAAKHEGEASDDPAQAKKKIDAAADTIKNTSDADLRKLSADDKVKLLKDLQAGGKPTGPAREAQLKLLRDMELDPGFKARESARADRIADALKGDKELEAARDNWKTLTDDDKVKALKKVLQAQCKEYGVPMPEIEVGKPQPPYRNKNGEMRVKNGSFNGTKIVLNPDPSSKMSNFGKACDLILHENLHNYQKTLIEELAAGKIKPGDPDFAQAEMFAANNGPSGYIPPGEDTATYAAQPKEAHSKSVGPETAQKILDEL